jgi:hypothetical protein
MTEAIVQRCLAIRPDLLPPDQTKPTIKRSTIGLRPCRKSGIRVEGEWISMHIKFFLNIYLYGVLIFFSLASEKFNKKVLVCHNYGHGGAGK